MSVSMIALSAALIGLATGWILRAVTMQPVVQGIFQRGVRIGSDVTFRAIAQDDALLNEWKKQNNYESQQVGFALNKKD